VLYAPIIVNVSQNATEISVFLAGDSIQLNG